MERPDKRRPARLAALAAITLAIAAAGALAWRTAGAQTAGPAIGAAAPLVFTPSGDAGFDAWRIDFARRAIAAGRRQATVFQLLEGLTPEPRSIQADQNQAEFIRPPWDYIQSAVSPRRVGDGLTKRAENAQLFGAIQQRYGVDADIVAGIWAVETNYGQVTLGYDAPRAIATLAYDPRRRAQFEGYLLALIEMVERGYAGPQEMRSSWAGAMGQPQFMPDVYLTSAVDWDGDGRRDIWTNTGDVLASIANYLAERGWRPGGAVFEEAQLPAGFDYALADGGKKPLSEWARLGVRRVDGSPFAPSEEAAEVFLPAGAQGPALLLYANFDVIKRYNNSDRYALAVALLARAFEGRSPGFVRPWPTEIGALRRDEMVELQGLLNRLGYPAGVADGMFGSGTRRAVRQFQLSRNDPADGYPTPALLAQVRAAAGVPAPPAGDPAPSRPDALAAQRTAAGALGPAGVRELQRVLSRLGHPIGTPNGQVGPRTRAAIQAEERRLGLSPTGKANTFILRQAKQRLARRR